MKYQCAACLMAITCFTVATPAYTQTGDIESLRRQVADLEAQNRQIMAQLADLSSRLQTEQEQATTKTATLVTEDSRSRLSFYGFARVDAIIDDSRPNATQTPTYILSENPGTENNDSFTLHPRLTRMGMNYSGPVINLPGDPKISGRIETDFQNGGSESRAIPRIRHVYANLDWDRGSLLLGQTWDIIAPLYPSVNADTMMWNAGNLGDRRMQIRFTYTPEGPLSLVAGFALTGAINLQDLDGNGVRDGEDSGIPHFQGRAGYKTDWFDIGFWGHLATEETALAINGRTAFESHSLGVDFNLQPLEFFSVKGEFWIGSGLGDVRGGIGQSINTLNGREIDGTGGWLELGFKPLPAYSISTGWTFDNPENDDLAAGSRKLNRAWYITNQLRLGPAFLLGLDYLRWQTDYLGLPDGTDHRFNLYGVYNF